MIEEPGVSNVGSAAHRYAELPIRCGTSTVRRPRGIVEHSVVRLLDRLQHTTTRLLGLERFGHIESPRQAIFFGHAFGCLAR